MIYKTFKTDGIKLSVLGLGMGAFNLNKNPSVSLENARKILEYAIKNGINFIDFGKDYNEEFIGKIIKNQNNLHTIVRSESKNVKMFKRDIKDSLNKLRLNSIDIYQIMTESVDDIKNMIDNGITDVFNQFKSKGKIKLAGIFSHKIEVLEEAVKSNEFDVVMTIYNMVHRMAERVFPMKKKYDFLFIAAAPFATGILIDPKYDRNVHKAGSDYMTVENSLKFILSSKYVDAVVVGTKNIDHLKENIAVASKNWKLSEKQRDKMSKKAESFLGKNFCRMCRYCEGCQGVSIADILKLLTIGKSYGYINFVKWQYKFIKRKIKNKDFKECEKLCPYNLPINKMVEELKSLVTK